MRSILRKSDNRGGAQPEVKVKKKGRKKKIIIIIVVVVILLPILRGCAGGGDGGVMVTTTGAFRGDLQESVSTSGTVEAETVRVLFAPANGKLGKVNVAAGDAVAKGDVLISYDSEDLERSFRQATLEHIKADASYGGAASDNSENQAKLREADTNLAVLEQQLKDYKAYLKTLQSELSESQRGTSNALAEDSYDLQKEISKIESELKSLDESTPEWAAKAKRLSKLQSELSRNQYLQSVANSSDYVAEMEKEISYVQEQITACEEYKAKMESQKNSSEAAVWDSYDRTQCDADKELAGISYNEAEKAYYDGKTGICAEFDGVVTQVSAVEGSSVVEGTQLLTLESSDAVKVSFSASKHDVEKLAIGQSAEVTISGDTYTGKVSKINRMATVNASNTPMVGVEIHIDQPDDRIILGLDAKLSIHTQKAEDALLIPVEAVNADK
ncbi:MAG: HlyD family efflux transporter periplasmic adaptor subunit, partial [Butyrivibrio sp.]|nr:HlyD family efflux transporter periplasmic adaptor subunit [Butyrivibrio sp.]